MIDVRRAILGSRIRPSDGTEQRAVGGVPSVGARPDVHGPTSGRSGVDRALPLIGLRHPPDGRSCGWYLWTGVEITGSDDSFFADPCVARGRRRPAVLPYLALPQAGGSRSGQAMRHMVRQRADSRRVRSRMLAEARCRNLIRSWLNTRRSTSMRQPSRNKLSAGDVSRRESPMATTSSVASYGPTPIRRARLHPHLHLPPSLGDQRPATEAPGPDLLLPPRTINRLGWSRGYFLTVAHALSRTGSECRPLLQTDALEAESESFVDRYFKWKRSGRMANADLEFYDEDRTARRRPARGGVGGLGRVWGNR